MNDQDAFDEWFAKRDVWPRITYDEVWHAALAYLRSQQEPVAWVIPGAITRDRDLANANKHNAVPLYAAPQPDVPDGWQPIETAPKDGSYMLVSNGRGVWVARYKAVYQSGWKPVCPWQSMMLNHDHIPSTQRKGHPTHWMPLPAAPEPCAHHYVRDEEAVRHHCCQKCGDVKEDVEPSK